MGAEKRVKCAWCGKETGAAVTREKSDYGNIVVRKCTECDKIIASYLDEDKTILEKVRSFQ